MISSFVMALGQRQHARGSFCNCRYRLLTSYRLARQRLWNDHAPFVGGCTAAAAFGERRDTCASEG